MKLLYICHAYPPGGGGVGSFVQTIARGMVKKGHEVHIAEPWRPDTMELPVYENDHGVHIHRIGVRWNIDKLWNNKSAAARLLLRLLQHTKLAFLLFLLRSFLNAKYIASLAAEKHIDIAEVPDGNEGGLLAARIAGTLLLVRLHGSATLMDSAGVRVHGWFGTAVYKRIERKLLLRADAVIAVSRFTATLAQRFYPKQTPEIPVIYNVVPPSDIQWKITSPPYVLFAGSISRNKGIITLAKAWNIVAVKHPEAKLTILGAGDESLVWNNVQPAYHAGINLAGNVPGNKVLEYMAGASCFVLPSYYESFSIAVEEAMSVGCPVIYTERCSGPEIIDHGKDGILTDPDDMTGLAAWIIKILEDKALAEILSRAARRKALRFTDVDGWLNENEAVYVNLLEKHTVHG